MTALSQLLQVRQRKPSRVLVVPSKAFADDWGGKPESDVAIGIRLLSEADIQTATAEAAKLAHRFYVDRDGAIVDGDAAVKAFNDALIRWAIARAATDPNDAAVQYFECAEDTVRVALTPWGARLIWDAIEETHILESPTTAEVEDEEIGELVELLEGGAVGELEAAEGRRVRRLLGHVLSELRAVSRG